MANILLVDDESAVRTALKSLIDWKSSGFNIAGEASDGEEALEIIRKGSVDIIVTDIRMPVMDGLELIQKVKQINNDIKMVVLSSYDDFHLVRNAFNFGACDYILKTEMDPGRIIEICKRLEKEHESEKKQKELLKERDTLEKQLYQNRNINRFISGKGKLISYEEIPMTPNQYDLKQADRVEYLRQALQSMDSDTIKKSASFLYMPETGVLFEEMASVRRIYEKYAWLLIDFIEQYGFTQKCEALLQKYYHFLWNMGSIEELNQWLSNVLAVISDDLSIENWHVNLAMKFIHRNINKELSLTTVADALHVTGGHLSKLFLKELGCSFIDYLNSYRIEKAKEYMKSSNMKIYEISEKVGYRNVEHFTRLFKKIVGKSPGEFAGIYRHEIDG